MEIFPKIDINKYIYKYTDIKLKIKKWKTKV
jgi:hypothetical protein